MTSMITVWQPLLTPYELEVMLQEAAWPEEAAAYPMDYYSSKGGPWTKRS